MANPEQEEKLDFIDKISVILYRFGISLFALTALLFAFSINFTAIAHWLTWVVIGLSAASALCAANVHVYSKWVRLLIVWPSWVGLVLSVTPLASTHTWLILGCFFVTFSGIALKESFCFKVVGLPAVPLFLIGATAALWLQQPLYAGIALAIAAGIMGYLSYQKWKMPLHFDIGIKANYQV